MKNFKSILIAISLLLLQSQLAQGATVRLDQLWNHQNFGIGGNQLNLITSAFYSDSGITGAGTEEILLDRFTVLRLDGSLGLNFSVADFFEPRSLLQEGNIFARHIDGVFQFLSHVDTGGAARIQIRTGDLSGPISGSININGGELVYHFPISGSNNYLLQSSTFSTLPPPSVIPLPGALLLFASALFGLGVLNRRKILTRSLLPSSY